MESPETTVRYTITRTITNIGDDGPTPTPYWFSLDELHAKFMIPVPCPWSVGDTVTLTIQKATPPNAKPSLP